MAQLSGTDDRSTANVVLSSVGLTDWWHPVSNTPTAVVKSGGGGLISGPSLLGAANYSYNGSYDASTMSWVGGSPTATGSDNGVLYYSTGGGAGGYRWTVPADTNVATLDLFLDTIFSSGGAPLTITATLSDGSAGPYTANVTSDGDWNVHITFQAGSAGQTLTIDLTSGAGGAYGLSRGIGLSVASAAAASPPFDSPSPVRLRSPLRGLAPGDALSRQAGVFTGTGFPDRAPVVRARQALRPGSMGDSLPPMAVASPALPPPDMVRPLRPRASWWAPSPDVLPPQNQIFVAQEASNFDPTSGSTISVSITTTNVNAALHIIVVGTHPTQVPWINTSGAASIPLNYADDPSVTHDFEWQLYRLNTTPFGYTITASYRDTNDHTVSVNCTNRGILVREIANAHRTIPPLAVAQEQNVPGAGTDAISAGTIGVFARPALASAVSWATTSAAGPPSAGTGFTAGAALFPKLGVNQALSEQMRVVAFAPVSGTFTHALGAANDYDTVMALFAEAGAETGLSPFVADARLLPPRRVLPPLAALEALPALAPAAPAPPTVEATTVVRRLAIRRDQQDAALPPMPAVVVLPPLEEGRAVRVGVRRQAIESSPALPPRLAPPEPTLFQRIVRRVLPQPSPALPPLPPVVFGPAPEAPRAIRALKRIWRLILEVGWPATATVIYTTPLPPFQIVEDDYVRTNVDSTTVFAIVEDDYVREVSPMKPRKVGDTADPFSGTLYANGAPRPLAGSSVVLFIWDSRTHAIKINGAAVTIEPSGTGTWAYAPLDADVDTAGIYEYELRERTALGKTAHYPSSGKGRLVIEEAIG